MTALGLAGLLEASLTGIPAAYPATVASVHDGDTFTVDVRLPLTAYGINRPIGFGLAVAGRRLYLRTKVRLAGANAAELGTPGGDAAAANLTALLPAGAPVTLSRVRVDDYGGRVDAAVELPDGRDLTMILVRDHWAAPYSGSGAKPVPPWPRP